MHVGVLTLRDLSTAGGGSIRVIGASRYLSQLGCRVTLFSPSLAPPLQGSVRFVPIQVPLRRRLLLSYSAFPNLLSGLRHLPSNERLASLVGDESIDLIHCHGHLAGSLMLLLRRRSSTPIALDVHGIKKLRHESGGLGQQLRRVLALRGESRLFRHVDAIVVRTETERDYIARSFDIPPSGIYVVPNGVDVAFLSQPASKADKEALRAELGLQGKRIILWAGGFKGRSGVMDLVRALRILNSRRSDVALVLIGDVAPLTREVKTFIDNEDLSNAILLGRQPREKFRTYQQIADVVVTPEIQDAYNELAVPLKLLDCLASGRPTVATRTLSHTQIVEDGVNGFLVNSQDPSDMARGIERALSSTRAAEIGNRGRQTVLKDYSWHRSAEHAVRAYADIISRRANRANVN